jgi:G-protein alpha subunit
VACITLFFAGFDKEELEQFKPIIKSNVIECIKVLVHAAQDMDAQLAPENMELGEKFVGVNAIDVALDPRMAEEISKLWHDPAIKRAYDNRSKFQLPDR